MRVAITFLALLAMARPATVRAVNLAPNGSFERAAEGGGPAGWHPWGGSNPPENVALDRTTPHSGEACLRVTDPSTTANWYAASDYIPMAPQDRYYIVVWARSDGPRTGAVRFDMLDSEKQYLGSRAAPLPATTTWQRFRLAVLDAMPQAAFAQISLVATGGQYPETGVMWLDDVTVSPLMPDGALEPGGAPVVARQVSQPDPASWFPFPIPLLDPATDGAEGERSSALDAGDLVDAPTGTKGFLKVGADGHFHWESGGRARFWGTNIHASNACFPTHQQAESFARRLRRQGVNLLRTHLLEYEAPGGLIAPGPTSRSLDPAQLERFDYLLYQLHLNGIYIIPDALPMCARKLKEADGIAGWDGFPLGAKGASQFDEALIALEQEYARQFLLHENPYTGKRLVDDPTVALLEMSNEDSLFLVGKWGPLPEHYQRELNRRWNAWLLAKYKAREALKAAWTDEQGVCALGEDEDPVAGTVKGGTALYVATWSRENTGDDAPARLNDASRFLYELQRRYYAEQVAFLRGIGVRAPITGSNIASDEALLKACDVVDFTDHHAYWDHPQYEGGNESSLHNRPQVKADLTTEEGLVNGLSIGKVAGKPFIATEWNSLWPNEWRSADVLSTAAYACLQDWDAVFIYCYLGGWGIGFDTAQERIHHATVIFADPAQAGLFPAASRLFLRHDVAAARNLVEVGYSETDTFFPQYYGLRRGGPHQALPYVSRMQKAYFDERYEPSAAVTVTATSGNSATGDYRRAKRLLLAVDNPYTGADLRMRDPLASARRLGPSLGFEPNVAPGLSLPDRGSLPAPPGLLIVPQWAFPAGATPLGPEADGQWLGYVTRDHALVPSLFLLLGPAPDLYSRVATQAMREWGLLGRDQGYLPAEHAVCSDTGELRSEWATGAFRVATKRTAGAAGFLAVVGAQRLGDVTIRCETSFATIVVTSVDGQSIDISDRLLVTAVGRAGNTGQRLEYTALAEEDGSLTPQGPTTVAALGIAPVLAEPVVAEVTLHRAASGIPLKCFALDPGGRRMAEVPLTPVSDGVLLKAEGKHRTIYYELAVH